MVLVCEECLIPCPRSTLEQRTNTHATQHVYLASTSGFTSAPLSYLYVLPAPCLITDLMCPMMFILCCYVSRQLYMRLRTHDVISFTLCDRCMNCHGILINELSTQIQWLHASVVYVTNVLLDIPSTSKGSGKQLQCIVCSHASLACQGVNRMCTWDHADAQHGNSLHASQHTMKYAWWWKENAKHILAALDISVLAQSAFISSWCHRVAIYERVGVDKQMRSHSGHAHAHCFVVSMYDRTLAEASVQYTLSLYLISHMKLCMHSVNTTGNTKTKYKSTRTVRIYKTIRHR